MDPHTTVHEAAHAVAAYLTGVEIAVLDVGNATTWSRGLGGHGEDGIVVALAGTWGCRALGVDASGGHGDDRIAARIARAASGSSEAAVDLLTRCHDRTIVLVASERFRDLVMRLTNHLVADPHPMTGERCFELLRGWDPVKLEGVHSLGNQRWGYFRRGRLIFSSNRRDKVQRREREGARVMTRVIEARPHLR